MKKFAFIIGVICLAGMISCNSNQGNTVILSRDFPSSEWERFDFVKETLTIKKATTYDLTMEVSFDDTYPFDYFSVVFTVFDTYDQPIRAKNYKYSVKDKEGVWKSDLENGLYTFKFPINSEMSFNEPGDYILQLENRMPNTPLTGVHHVAIVAK